MKKLVVIAMFLVLGCLFGNVFCFASEQQIKDEQLLLKDRLLSLDRQNNDQAEEKNSEFANKRANEFSAYSGNTWYSEDPNDLAPLKGTKWKFTYINLTTFTDTITFGTGITRDLSDNIARLPCTNEHGDQGFASYCTLPWGGMGFIAVITRLPLKEIYLFTINGNIATGEHGFWNDSTDWYSYFYYMTGVKISGPSVPVCDANHPNLCITEYECKAAGGYWYDGLCHADPSDFPTTSLNNWHVRSAPVNNPLFAVTYGKNIFVAVGNNGTILTSPDGTVWTNRSISGISNLESVAYGNNMFIAVGWDGIILTSPGGVTWTRRISGTSIHLNDVIFAGNTFVVLGSLGTILTSQDGITWTARVSGTDKNLFEVTYGKGVFVVTGGGSDSLGGTYTKLILTSSDAITWTQRISGNGKIPTFMAYGNSTFVGIDSDGTVFTSSDGITWIIRDSSIPFDIGIIEEMVYVPSAFIAIGWGSELFTSPDGITWTSRDSGTTEVLSGVTYGNNSVVIVGFGYIYDDPGNPFGGGTGTNIILQSDPLASPGSSVGCSASNLNGCITQYDCETYGGIWCSRYEGCYPPGDEPSDCSASGQPLCRPEQAVPNEQVVRECDIACQQGAPVKASAQTLDVCMNYSEPVTAVVGIMTQDFSAAQWLSGDDCSFSDNFQVAMDNSQYLDCSNVQFSEAFRQGWVFWLVSPVSFDQLDWQSGDYELLFNQIPEGCPSGEVEIEGECVSCSDACADLFPGNIPAIVKCEVWQDEHCQ